MIIRNNKQEYTTFIQSLANDIKKDTHFEALIQLLYLENLYSYFTDKALKDDSMKKRSAITDEKGGCSMSRVEEIHKTLFTEENPLTKRHEEKISSLIHGGPEVDLAGRTFINISGMVIDYSRAYGHAASSNLLSKHLFTQLSVKQLFYLDSILFEAETAATFEFLRNHMPEFLIAHRTPFDIVKDDKRDIISLFDLSEMVKPVLRELIPISYDSLSDLFKNNDCELTDEFKSRNKIPFLVLLRFKINALTKSLHDKGIFYSSQNNQKQSMIIQGKSYQLRPGYEQTLLEAMNYLTTLQTYISPLEKNNGDRFQQYSEDVKRDYDKVRKKLSPQVFQSQTNHLIKDVTESPNGWNRFKKFLKQHKTKIIVSAVIAGLLVGGIFTFGILSTAGIIAGTGLIAVAAAKLGFFAAIIGKVFGLATAVVAVQAAVGTTVVAASSAAVSGSTAILQSALEDHIGKKGGSVKLKPKRRKLKDGSSQFFSTMKRDPNPQITVDSDSTDPDPRRFSAR